MMSCDARYKANCSFTTKCSKTTEIVEFRWSSLEFVGVIDFRASYHILQLNEFEQSEFQLNQHKIWISVCYFKSYVMIVQLF